MNYENKAFCDQPNCKKFNKCHRALKLADMREAEKSGLKIMISEFECYEPKDS